MAQSLRTKERSKVIGQGWGNRDLTLGLLYGPDHTAGIHPRQLRQLRDQGIVPRWEAGFNERGSTLDQITQENPLAEIVVLRWGE